MRKFDLLRNALHPVLLSGAGCKQRMHKHVFKPGAECFRGSFFHILHQGAFGIWQGYHPTLYSQDTFPEVHRGAVQGLNTLLPLMGLATMIMTLVLILRSDRHATVCVGSIGSPLPRWLWPA